MKDSTDCDRLDMLLWVLVLVLLTLSSMGGVLLVSLMSILVLLRKGSFEMNGVEGTTTHLRRPGVATCTCAGTCTGPCRPMFIGEKANSSLGEAKEHSTNKRKL